MRYKDIYVQMHKDGHFAGNSLRFGYVETLERAIKGLNCRTMLDYGCGKAQMYRRYKFHNLIGIEDHGLYLYDPAVPRYDYLTKDLVDAVICTDVLEHVPEDEIDVTLSTVFSKAKKMIFFVVYCGLANKTFDDGTNVHVTVKPPEWWDAKFDAHNVNGVKVMAKFLFPLNPEKDILNTAQRVSDA